MQDSVGVQQIHIEEPQKVYEAPEHISPSNITGLYSTLSKFLEGGKKRVAFLDGLEYLITQNSFSSILRMIQSLNDRAVPNGNQILISIDPVTLSTREYHLLQRESSERYGLNLIGETSVDKGYINFVQNLCKGYDGLCVTRLYQQTKNLFEDVLKAPDLPEECSKKIKSTPVYWLTTNRK